MKLSEKGSDHLIHSEIKEEWNCPGTWWSAPCGSSETKTDGRVAMFCNHKRAVVPHIFNFYAAIEWIFTQRRFFFFFGAPQWSSDGNARRNQVDATRLSCRNPIESLVTNGARRGGAGADGADSLCAPPLPSPQNKLHEKPSKTHVTYSVLESHTSITCNNLLRFLQKHKHKM